jgi:hypothetical protein
MQRTRSHSDSSLLLLVDLPGMMRKAWSHVFMFEGYVFETHVCVSLHFVLFHFEITAVCLTPRRGFLISFHFTSACFLFVLACQCSFCFRIPFVCPIAVMLFQLLPGGRPYFVGFSLVDVVSHYSFLYEASHAWCLICFS